MRKRLFKYMAVQTAATALITALVVVIAEMALFGIPLVISVLHYFERGLFVALCVLVVGVILSAILSERLVRPIKRADPEVKELSPLLERLDAQSDRIRESTSELEEKDQGLQTIMENMNEGLVLLNQDGLIMGLNHAAARLLELPVEANLGVSVFAVIANPVLQAAVRAALLGGSGEELLKLDSAAVQVLAHPVWVDGCVRGVVLLAFDVTEKQEIERMRREFSANVSHELKTPLTSISGYAELMTNGLARPEDMRDFSEKIYFEAARLIALIEDILLLSHLDEGGRDIPAEQLDLYAAAVRNAERLAEEAARCGVGIEVSGGPATINGNARIIDEIICNLCENAIKYNRPGGSVWLTVENAETSALLTVRDTGIGIPEEYQSRVFERFYRVDKSHSKETGGTGLGLSIVKHGALYHRAELELQSVAGEGTTVKVRFPKAENS